MIALSFHALFEGIAIGLEENKPQFITLALAISLHKWAEAITLGISFFKSQTIT